MNIVRVCRTNDVNDIYVSGITCRRKYERKISDINNILFDNQEMNGFIYIDNNDIHYHHIWKDGVHLNNEGIVVLANNFIKALNYGSTL